MTIHTRHINPPIPKFSPTGAQLWWPWEAYHEEDEGTARCGCGETEEEAIADLIRLDQEDAEYAEYMEQQERQQGRW